MEGSDCARCEGQHVVVARNRRLYGRRGFSLLVYRDDVVML